MGFNMSWGVLQDCMCAQGRLRSVCTSRIILHRALWVSKCPKHLQADSEDAYQPVCLFAQADLSVCWAYLQSGRQEMLCMGSSNNNKTVTAKV